MEVPVNEVYHTTIIEMAPHKAGIPVPLGRKILLWKIVESVYTHGIIIQIVCSIYLIVFVGALTQLHQHFFDIAACRSISLGYL